MLTLPCSHTYIYAHINTYTEHQIHTIHTYTHRVFGSRQDIHDIHCFLYEFNFKEVICDSHKLSVKCYNNQTVNFYEQLAVVKVSAFVVANLPPYAAV